MIKRSTTIQNNYIKPWARNGPDGSNTATPAYLPIDNAVLFDSGNSEYMSRTPSVAGNRKTWTFSTWVKRGKLGISIVLFHGYSSGIDGFNNFLTISFSGSNQLSFESFSTVYLRTTAVYRDIGAWMNVILVVDTTQATAVNRVKLYVNGIQVTAFSTDNRTSITQNIDGTINNTVAQYMSRYGHAASGYNDGYLADTYLIDGQALTPSSFGEYDANNNWVPKEYTGTYGTNGFHQEYANSSALGTDTSGNGNTYTTSGLTTNSQVQDTPTNNYCVLNPIDVDDVTDGTPSWSKGNLHMTATGGSANASMSRGSIPTSSGKWYWEVTIGTVVGTYSGVGIANPSDIINTSGGNFLGSFSSSIGYLPTGQKSVANVLSSYGVSYTTSDVIGVKLDVDNSQITFYKNNVSQGVLSVPSGGAFVPAVSAYLGSYVDFNFGQRAFTYTPPTGFKALNTQNLPEPAILNPHDHFDVDLFTSTASTLSRSPFNFSPDLVWLKNRDQIVNHAIYDTVRGTIKRLIPNTTNAEGNIANTLTSFDANGYTVGNQENSNYQVGDKSVAWCWKKGATPGFDIVSYTGNGSNRTINHSLGVAPEMMIVKNRSNADSWIVYHKDMASSPEQGRLHLNDTGAYGVASTVWNNTAPTSTVFSVGTTTSTNGNTNALINYLFAGVEGFSKFGKYTGNGSTDGPFVWCGFRPAYIMVKRTDSTGSWRIHDGERTGYNADTAELNADLSDTEYDASSYAIDILSNGFKLRNVNTGYNASGGTYIFAAFAEAPFSSARAR